MGIWILRIVDYTCIITKYLNFWIVTVYLLEFTVSSFFFIPDSIQVSDATKKKKTRSQGAAIFLYINMIY